VSNTFCFAEKRFPTQHDTPKLASGVGKLVVQIHNLLKIKIHPRVSLSLIRRKIRWRLRGIDAKGPTAFGGDNSKGRYLQALLRSAHQRREELVYPPRLAATFRQKTAVEHADDWLLWVRTQAKNGQVEPNALKRLLEMAPERLLVEEAKAS
jgi:hypothetical protein